MKQPSKSIQCLCRILVGTAAVVALSSCGGGVIGSGGTGKRDNGQAVGTVNGFGSVIVDGVSYDALGASVVTQIAPSVDALTEVKLGQRVSIDYETPGVARQVRVESTLSGPVSGVSATGLSVLGQTIAINAGSAAGPRTEFGGGYTQIGDVQAGDYVDIHGVLVQGVPFYAIQATRIEKLPSAPAFLRATGLVSGLVQTGSVSLSMAGLTVDATDAALLPVGSVLANGQAATLLAPFASLATAGNGKPTVRAAEVRILKLEDGGLEDIVSGSIAHLDVLAKTFVLGSLKVSYATASATPAGTALTNGQYVRVNGAVGSDGMLIAAGIAVRDGESGNESELRGNISAFDAVAQRLTVRGVNVDVGGATLLGCPPSGLSNGLFVDIDGSLSGNGVAASTVRCEAESSGSTVEREGVATTVDVVMQRFTLTSGRGVDTLVQWSSTTFFGSVTPSTLDGKDVEIEGALVGGVLMASKVKADH